MPVGGSRGGKRGAESPAGDAEGPSKRRRTQNGDGAGQQGQEPAHRRRAQEVDAQISSSFNHRVGSKWIDLPRWQLGETRPHVLRGALKRCHQVLKELMKRKGGQFFVVPVDPDALNLPDYFQVVADPLDLGTVEKAMEAGFYSYDYGGVPGNERLAQDVDRVFANALLYNPPGNIVSDSATELQAYAREQFAKIFAEESAECGTAAGWMCARQLVMNDYCFLDAQDRVVLPELLLQKGTEGMFVEGNLLPTVPGGEADGVHVLRISALQFDVVDSKEGAKVQVWIRSEEQDAWVVLLKPAQGWSAHASRWLFNHAVCEVAKRYASENPHNLQYDKLLRTLVKSTCPGATGLSGEAKVKKALADSAEYLAVCVEHAQAGSSMQSQRENSKLSKKLLEEAEKERAKEACAKLQAAGGKGGSGAKDALATCSALCHIISEVELKWTRETYDAAQEEQRALKKEAGKSPTKTAGPGTPRALPVSTPTPAKAAAAASAPVKAAAGSSQKGKGGEDVVMAEPEPEKQGYWERDDDGNRRWVDISTPASGKKRKAGEDEAGAPTKRVAQILRDEPVVPMEGGLAKVLFDDGTWYVGRLTSHVGAKWHIVFSDGDEDDIKLPDPDVQLLPPIPLLVQALEEYCEEIKQGIKEVLGKPGTPASVSDKQDEVRKAVSMTRRNLKECLLRTTTGRSKEGEGSVEEVRENFVKRIHTRVVLTDKLLTQAQWNAIVSFAADLGRSLDFPDEKPSKSKAKSAAASSAPEGGSTPKVKTENAAPKKTFGKGTDKQSAASPLPTPAVEKADKKAEKKTDKKTEVKAEAEKTTDKKVEVKVEPDKKADKKAEVKVEPEKKSDKKTEVKVESAKKAGKNVEPKVEPEPADEPPLEAHGKGKGRRQSKTPAKLADGKAESDQGMDSPVHAVRGPYASNISTPKSETTSGSVRGPYAAKAESAAPGRKEMPAAKASGKKEPRGAAKKEPAPEPEEPAVPVPPKKSHKKKPHSSPEPEVKHDELPDEGVGGAGDVEMKVVWPGCPEWLYQDASVEVKWDDDWWQATAVEFKKGEVLCHYVGGDDEQEWVSLKSGRIRPPEDEDDELIVSEVGEIVEVRRPQEKKNRKWHLAKVVEIDTDTDAPSVLVSYLHRSDIDDEWIPMDESVLRLAPLERTDSTPDKDDSSKRGSKKPNTRAWPCGELLEGDNNADVVGPALVLLQFFRSFGRSACLKDLMEKWADKWSGLTVEGLMADVAGAEAPEYIVGLVTALIGFVFNKDDREGLPNLPPGVHPDSLTWPAWLMRVIDRDIKDRGKRALKERLEESFLDEEALAEVNIARALLMPKAAVKQKKAAGQQEAEKPSEDDSKNAYDEINGLAASIVGSGPFSGVTIQGEMMAGSDYGIKVSCCGVEMSIHDFARFGGANSKQAAKKCVLAEAKNVSVFDLEKEYGVKVEGDEAEVNWNKSIEYLMGGEFLSPERAMLKDLGGMEWAKLAVAARWNVLMILAELALESDQVRGVLLATAGEGPKTIQTKNVPSIPSSQRLLAAMPPPDPAAEARAAEEAKRDALGAPFRIEPLGWDRAGRRYWLFPWSKGNFAVEVPKPPSKKAPYSRHGENRGTAYEASPDWFFYTEEGLEALLQWLVDGGEAGENKLIKRLKHEKSEILERKKLQEAQEAAKAAEAQRLAALAAGAMQQMPTQMPAQMPLQMPPQMPTLGTVNLPYQQPFVSAAQTLAVPAAPANAAAAATAAPTNATSSPTAAAVPPANAALTIKATTTPGGALVKLAVPAAPPTLPPAAAPASVLTQPVVAARPANSAAAVAGSNGILGLTAPPAFPVFAEPLDHYPPRGEYLAKEDETPIGIADRFGIDVNVLCKMNEEMYAGLHTRARFKNGTLLMLPTPTPASLNRPVTRPPRKILRDLVQIVRIEMQVFPLSYRVHYALTSFVEVAAKDDVSHSAIADALIVLEHALLLPCIPDSCPHPSDRLLNREWIKFRRTAWVEELSNATSLSQVALALQEFQSVALEGMRRVRDLAVTRWMYKLEINKAAANFKRGENNEQMPVLMPDKGEHVVYLKQGHMLHLEQFPQRVWDCMPSVSVAFCVVEATWSFKSAGPHAFPFCCLQLRPVPQEAALVGHDIVLMTAPSHPAMRLPQPCKVLEWQEKREGGGDRQHLLKFEGGEGEIWVCLDDCKMQLRDPNEGGKPFFVTLHCQQKLPDFILQPQVVRGSLKPWEEGTRVRMWFWNEDMTGSYYTGVVVECKIADDPWDSIRVQWDCNEGEEAESDWVCPWELRRWEGAAAVRNKGSITLHQHAKNVVTTPAEAAKLPDGGTYVTEEDETPRQVAAAANVDLDLLVILNKSEYQGLTKLSKLLKGTRLRLPPQGVRYERAPIHGVQSDYDAARGASHLFVTEMKLKDFNKDDEAWWEGSWTDEMQLSCANMLRKLKRNRSSSDFLNPVDYVGLGLEDYLEVVKVPMDLSTIETKLDSAGYKEPKEMIHDVRLMLSNAMAYNPPGEPTHRNAIQLWNFFEEIWRVEKDEIASKKGKRRTIVPNPKYAGGAFTEASPPPPELLPAKPERTTDVTMSEADSTTDAKTTEVEPISEVTTMEAEPTTDVSATEVEPTTDVATMEAEPTADVNATEVEPTSDVATTEVEHSTDVTMTEA